jgi:quercetin dioxygenase-like cupin family protein
MKPVDREIYNPRTGQRMRFLDTDEAPGELLRIETVNPPTAIAEPEHVHPRQESNARVISGTLRFTVEGRERRLEPGESITIPAGTPHFFLNDGAEDAVAIQELRPALRTAEMFATLFGLAEQGKIDARGMPSLLTLARLGPVFADEIRVTSPPWPVQRAAFFLLGPIARLRGHTVM